jgi:hypothetical protein
LPDLIRPSIAATDDSSTRETNSAKPGRRDAKTTLVVIVVVTLVLGGVYLASGRHTDAAASAVSTTAGWTATEAPLPSGLDHIHDLVRNPRTGQTLAGTHNGLYEVTTTGAATLIGTSRDDLTGLAVDANGTLWASGHAAGSTSDAGVLGLIRSADGGVTWSVVSRQGQSDFHALTVRGSTIVGAADDTVLRSTDDGTTWTSGARSTVGSLTLDSSALWVTTPTGLQRSTDDGATMAPVADAPTLVLGALAPDKTVWGVTGNGSVTRWLGPDRWDTVAMLNPGEQIQAILGLSRGEVLIATSTRSIRVSSTP